MDGHVIIGTPDPQFFDFMKAIGREDVREDPRFATAEQRLIRGRADELEIDYLLPWMLERTKADISVYLQSQRLSCTPVLTLTETLSDPAYRGRGFWQRVEHPIAGPLDHCAPFRFSASPTPPLRPAPRLGEHNVDVYRGELGLSPAEMARLRRLHVI
jgi:crotonobetainyl-CoA:carnitine CoA-transferase CaiB-like acyl-CoA transferase